MVTDRELSDLWKSSTCAGMAAAITVIDERATRAEAEAVGAGAPWRDVHEKIWGQYEAAAEFVLDWSMILELDIDGDLDR